MDSFHGGGGGFTALCGVEITIDNIRACVPDRRSVNTLTLPIELTLDTVFFFTGICLMLLRYILCDTIIAISFISLMFCIE